MRYMLKMAPSDAHSGLEKSCPEASFEVLHKVAGSTRMLFPDHSLNGILLRAFPRYGVPTQSECDLHRIILVDDCSTSWCL